MIFCIVTPVCVGTGSKEIFIKKGEKSRIVSPGAEGSGGQSLRDKSPKKSIFYCRPP